MSIFTIELDEFSDSVLKLINKNYRGVFHLNSINKPLVLFCQRNFKEFKNKK